MEKTKEWWTDALQRFINTDQVIRFDGIYMDFLTPADETVNKTCPNNKWNDPVNTLGIYSCNTKIVLICHIFTFCFNSIDFLPNPIYNGTICMDSRHSIGKHYNLHGAYPHYIIETTAK